MHTVAYHQPNQSIEAVSISSPVVRNPKANNIKIFLFFFSFFAYFALARHDATNHSRTQRVQIEFDRK